MAGGINVPSFLMGNNVRPDLERAYNGVTNVLGQMQDQQNRERAFAEQQRQFNAQNMLAQGRYNREGDALQQAKAQQGELRNILGDASRFPGVPQPLLEIGKVTGDPKAAQDYLIAEAKRKAGLAGPEEYGKAGAVFQDPTTGEFRAIQFGARGTLKTHPLTGMEPARGVKQVGDELVSGATGQTVRNMAPQIAGKERAEAIGKAGGAAAADVARIADNARQALDVIDKIRKHPGTDSNFGMIGMIPNRPGGAAADAWSLVEQLGGKAFLEAFNSLKGGGQITEVEGTKATNAIARMQKAQSPAAFRSALNDFAEVIRTGEMRARRQAGLGAAPTMTTGQSEAIPQVKTVEEAMKLPVGSKFIDPNGYVRER